MSELEDLLDVQMAEAGLPEPEREYRFAAEYVGLGKDLRIRLRERGLKDWRFDFAWPSHMLAVEVEGGAWVNGRHTRGKGFEEDLEKYHQAQALGWTVYRTSGHLIRSGKSVELLAELLKEPDIEPDIEDLLRTLIDA